MSETAPTPNEALRQAIQESGLRKDFIARQLGIKPYQLSYWLSGRVALKDADRVKLGLLLRRDPQDFVPTPVSVEDTTQPKAEAA